MRGFVCFLCTLLPAALPSQASLPFHVGERLEYRVSLSTLGEVGTGRMWVEADTTQPSLWILRFEIDAGKGPVRAEDRTASWLDPVRFAVVRYEKRERHPLSRSSEVVTMDLAAGTFTEAGHAPEALGSADPLDELSFIYLLRTLPVERDTTLELGRHFDPARNPTIVRVRDGGVIETPAGLFRTRLIEMDVKDPKRYRGTGTIRIHLTDDDCRVPVRIESRMPILGVTTLSLRRGNASPQYPDALVCRG